MKASTLSDIGGVIAILLIIVACIATCSSCVYGLRYGWVKAGADAALPPVDVRGTDG